MRLLDTAECLGDLYKLLARIFGVPAYKQSIDGFRHQLPEMGTRPSSCLHKLDRAGLEHGVVPGTIESGVYGKPDRAGHFGIHIKARCSGAKTDYETAS